jgi:hypothetical protein
MQSSNSAGRGRRASSLRTIGCPRLRDQPEYGERIKSPANAEPRPRSAGQRVRSAEKFTALLRAVGYAGSLCCLALRRPSPDFPRQPDCPDPEGPLLPGEVPDGA